MTRQLRCSAAWWFFRCQLSTGHGGLHTSDVGDAHGKWEDSVSGPELFPAKPL